VRYCGPAPALTAVRPLIQDTSLRSKHPTSGSGAAVGVGDDEHGQW